MINGEKIYPKCLEVVRCYLYSKGYVKNEINKLDLGNGSYRLDRGVEQKIENYIKNHPLNNPVGIDGPWPLNWNLAASSRDSGISLYEALRFSIPSACRIIIGVFQARRESEIASLTTKCISSSNEKLWFESYIAKTLRHERKLPTVKTVEDAILLLTRWGERGRKIHGNDYLFSYWEPLGGSVNIVKANADINRFAKRSLNLELSNSLQIRQFRRFFAITFMWRYRVGSLTALSTFLCHSGVTMTYEYVTEKVGASVLREVQSEFSKEILVNAATGKIKLIGTFGKAWHRLVEKIRNEVRSSLKFVDSYETGEKIFLEKVENNIRLLNPTPTGFCSAGERERDLKRAMCREEIEGKPGFFTKRPELTRPALCAVCPFGATDEIHKSKWEQISSDMREIANGDEDTVARRKARLDIQKIDKLVIQFDDIPKD